MKVFLIILGVLVLLTVLILSVSAEFTVIFDNGWSTKIRVLFYEKDIKLTELLSFVLFPDKAGKEAADKSKEKKNKKKQEKAAVEASDVTAPEADKTDDRATAEESDTAADLADSADKTDNAAKAVDKTADVAEISDKAGKAADKKDEAKPKAPAKKNPIMKILEEDGVVGIMSFASNLIQTLNSAVTTLIKGLHIYSLYVKMIIGGGDAADIGEKYGSVCGWYYPLKGYILNQMRVDNYDDYIQPDFIAPRSEYEFQFIGSISVGLLVKMLLKAGKTFIVNYIKNK